MCEQKKILRLGQSYLFSDFENFSESDNVDCRYSMSSNRILLGEFYLKKNSALNKTLHMAGHKCKMNLKFREKHLCFLESAGPTKDDCNKYILEALGHTNDHLGILRLVQA